MSSINSRAYWNQRFETDWVARRGREQSRFFARIALALMPDWLVQQLKAGATVCDFGCALGDGTVVLATALQGARFTGIDFSASAIADATAQYPQVPFVCRNLLEEPPEPQFEVVFSSNVLEHFQSPPIVLATLARHARRFMVHLVPFREPLATREPEHAAAFDWRDLALAPVPGWRLVHATVVRGADLPQSAWDGEQALLVLARDEEVVRLDLTLAQVQIESASGESARMAAVAAAAAAAREETWNRLAPTLAQRDLQMAELQSELAKNTETMRLLVAQLEQLQAENRRLAVEGDQRATAAAALQSENQRLQTEIEATRRNVAFLAAESQARQHDLETIRQSRIWRWTSPLRGGRN